MTFPDEYCGWYHAGSAYMEKCKFDGKKKSGNQIRAEGMLWHLLTCKLKISLHRRDSARMPSVNFPIYVMG